MIAAEQVAAVLQALRLEDSGWAAQRDACYAWQAVANGVEPSTSSGVRNVSVTSGGKQWRILFSTPGGEKVCAHMARDAADTVPPQAVLDKRDALIAEHGISARSGMRPAGVGDALLEAVAASAEGRRWLEGRKAPRTTLMNYVSCADHYAPDEWSPNSSRAVHYAMAMEPDRVALLASRAWTLAEWQMFKAARAKTPRAVPSLWEHMTRDEYSSVALLPKSLRNALVYQFSTGAMDRRDVIRAVRAVDAVAARVLG